MRLLVTGILTLVLLSAFSGTERDPFVQGYFLEPVSGTMLLSGTFGELRSNHFHAGIDIKGGMNVPILAAAEGYVSRIKVSGGGYGNVLYLTHPNGYTTVYAHLNRFHPDLAEWVQEQQYGRESFSVDLHPDPGQFTFAQGEEIGKMGTTGSSSGPHLHFEIRETKSEVPLNPLRFGLDFADNSALRIHELKIYEFGDQGLEQYTHEYYPSYRSGSYRISGDTIQVGARQTGMAIKAYDHMNNGRNWNGIYAVDMRVNGQLHFSFRMDALPFPERRYLNAHLDYAEQKTENSYYNRCYLLPGNRASIYEQVKDRGLITLEPGESVRIDLTVTGANGRTRALRYWLKREELQRPDASPTYQYWLPHHQDNLISNYYLYLHFPEGSLYADLPLQYQRSEESSYQVYSPIHHIHDMLTPLHRSFTLGIRPGLVPDDMRNKVFVGRCTSSGQIINYGGQWQDGMLVTNSTSFGDYGIFADTIPPVIQKERFSSDMRGWSSMRFNISDNLPTSGKARDLRFRATIDGRWVLLNYDAKNDRLTHIFEDDLPRGAHQLVLEVTDAMNNQSILEETFLY